MTMMATKLTPLTASKDGVKSPAKRPDLAAKMPQSLGSDPRASLGLAGSAYWGRDGRLKRAKCRATFEPKQNFSLTPPSLILPVPPWDQLLTARRCTARQKFEAEILASSWSVFALFPREIRVAGGLGLSARVSRRLR